MWTKRIASSRLAEYREKWKGIGLSTEPIDRAKCRKNIEVAYRMTDRKPPRDFLYFESPLGMLLARSVLASVSDSVRDSVSAAVSAAVLASVSASVSDSVRAAVSAFFWWYRWGTDDCAWLSFYDVFDCETTVIDKHPMLERLHQLGVVAKEAGYFLPFDQWALLSSRPLTLHRDDRERLHAEGAPAMSWSDGWAIWAWHGVRVPQAVIEAPQKLTINQLEQEPNIEVRRIMIQRFGQERYLLQSGAKKIHEDRWGILYRKERLGDSPLEMVHVVNKSPEPDGTFRDYFLRVKPGNHTALEAIAHSFPGVNPIDYERMMQLET